MNWDDERAWDGRKVGTLGAFDIAHKIRLAGAEGVIHGVRHDSSATDLCVYINGRSVTDYRLPPDTFCEVAS